MKNISIIIAALCLSMATVAKAEEAQIRYADEFSRSTQWEALLSTTAHRDRWVGPVGIQCYNFKPEGDRLKQLRVEKVDEGSPADGILKKGDIILGADGTGATRVPLFKTATFGTLREIADAITEAEARNPAILNLVVWRQNVTKVVPIQLEYLGRYSDTAPYNCEKSRNILRRGIKKLYEDNDPDRVGLAMLCLLAADDPTNPDNAKYQARAKEWAHQIEFQGGPWFSGPALISLSEYYMKTADQSIFPKLVKQAEHHARGVSWFGTTGHKWADERDDGSPRGRMSGYGPIGACGVQGLVGLSLARRAGVKSPMVEAANRDQRIFFGHYAFRGTASYGEFIYSFGGAPGDNNAKCAMTALALGMEENQEAEAKYFSKMATLSDSSDRVYAHGGSFFAQVWNPIGAAQGGVKAANLHFQANRWHFELKRSWDHSRIYDASGNDYNDFSWDATGLHFYALPLKQLYVTGRGQKDSLQFSDAEFQELLAVQNYDPAKRSTPELIADLSRFDTLCRSATGSELADRIKANPESLESAAIIDQLIALALDRNASMHGRAGACLVLHDAKHKSGGSMAELKNEEIVRAMLALQKDPAPFMWFSGIKVLQELPRQAVRPYVNEILDAAIAHGRPTFPLTEDDPLQASQIRISQLLFDSLIKDDLDDVDREKLTAAIKVLLYQPHANGRNSASKGLTMMPLETFLEVADAAMENIISRPPANAMGGTAALERSQDVMSKFMFESALPISFKYAPGAALKNKVHQKYGRAAFSMKSIDELMRILADQMLANASFDAGEIIREMHEAPPAQTIRKLKDIYSVKAAQPSLSLPASQTTLVADARNYAFPGTSNYTWRKVYGPGSVAFSPNGSAESKTTTVSFTDRKPGKYLFVLTLSDRLGYSEVSKTVEVTLFDKNGKLPGNRPPVAKSQSLEAAPGQALPIKLSGFDPDGDDLGFAVTQPPAHGTISGTGGDLTYTAKFGFNGTDSFTFFAFDGQGEAAGGRVEIKVSDQNVGVAVYEGFDYPTGPLHNKAGPSSFGFSGPWINSRDSTEGDLVAGKDSGKNASLSYPSIPSTGGRLIKGQSGTQCSRKLDRQVLNRLKMLEPGGEMWFSFFFADKTNRKLKFSTEEDVTFGARILDKHANSGVLAILNDETDPELNRNQWSRNAEQRFLEGPNMVVGRCIWGETDADPDTIEVYRVFDAPFYGITIPSEPVSTVKGSIPQERIEAIIIDQSGEEVPLDEIRIGPTQNSVMIGTQPL